MASRTARKGTSRYKIRNWKQYEAGLIQKGIGAQIDILIKIGIGAQMPLSNENHYTNELHSFSLH